MVDYVDDLVGRLVDTLDGLNLRDNTIVFFTADNGTVSGVQCKARGKLVNGGKATLAEPGICMPFIVAGPRVLRGRVTDELVDFSDVFPTLIDLTGARRPQGVTLDGRSFADCLHRQAADRPRREWIYSQLGEDRVVSDKRYKLYNDGRFYDIQADVLETNDLNDRDDPDIVAARARLSAVLKSLPPDATLPFKPGPHEPEQLRRHAMRYESH